MINLDEVVVGDQVTVRDRAGNLVIGQVEGITGTRRVNAFGTLIPFAQQGRGGKWAAVKGVQVVGHLPALPFA